MKKINPNKINNGENTMNETNHNKLYKNLSIVKKTFNGVQTRIPLTKKQYKALRETWRYIKNYLDKRGISHHAPNKKCARSIQDLAICFSNRA